LLDECQQVRVDLVGMGGRHSMRETRVHLQRGIFHQLRGLQGSRANGHNLVIVAMLNERWYVEPLEVFREVRLGESLDAVVACLLTPFFVRPWKA